MENILNMLAQYWPSPALIAGKIGTNVQMIYIIVFALLAWGIVWKALALWVSARRNQKWWFIALLVINTVGILEIVYLLFFSKVRRSSAQAVASSARVV